MSDESNSARINGRVDTEPSITVYDSRKKRYIGDAITAVADTVARLFGSEVPVAYDGNYVYIAIRLSEKNNRPQTCYAVVSADHLNDLLDLQPIITSTVEPTRFDYEKSTEKQLGYVSSLITSYNSAEVPREAEGLFRPNRSLGFGVPSYVQALALLDRAIDAEMSLAVSRRRAYFDPDSDEQLDFVDSVVVVDNQFHELTYDDDTQRAVDRVRSRRQKQHIETAVEPVGEVVADLRELGFDNTEIREAVVAELPADGVDYGNSGPIDDLLRQLDTTCMGRFDFVAVSRMVDTVSSTLSRRTMMSVITVISVFVFLVASAAVTLWQLGYLTAVPSLPSVSVPSPPSLPAVSVSVDASAVLLGAAAVTLLGFTFVVFARQ